MDNLDELRELHEERFGVNMGAYMDPPLAPRLALKFDPRRNSAA